MKSVSRLEAKSDSTFQLRTGLKIGNDPDEAPANPKIGGLAVDVTANDSISNDLPKDSDSRFQVRSGLKAGHHTGSGGGGSDTHTGPKPAGLAVGVTVGEPASEVPRQRSAIASRVAGSPSTT